MRVRITSRQEIMTLEESRALGSYLGSVPTPSRQSSL